MLDDGHGMYRQAHKHKREVRLAAGDERGFTLIEALVTIAIMTIIALSVSSLVGVGMLSNKSAADLTQATALSSTKLEQLRNTDYSSLTVGGSLADDQVGYFDWLDPDGDGTNDYLLRWQIADQPGGKRVEVLVRSNLASIGPAKSATVATVIAER